MSRHFFYRLFPFVKALAREAKPNIFTLLGTTIVTTYCHGSFALATNKTEEICVAKKYKYVSNGFTNFMIVDTNGRHFNVNNSFWYWKWDAIEEWTNIDVYNGTDNEKETTLVVSYYGYRIPFLGLFPNIVEFPTHLENFKKEKKEKRDILKHLHV